MPRKKASIERESQKIKGLVTRIFYSKPNFTAGIIKLSDSSVTSRFSGKAYVKEGEYVVLEGVYEEDPKYGRGFKVDKFEYDQELNCDGLVNYLSKHKELKGVGRVKAQKIFNEFGSNFSKVLEESPEKIASLINISLEPILKLQEEWKNKKSHAVVLSVLSSFGLSNNTVNKLLEKYGNSILNILEENPYFIIRDIPGYGFKRVDEIARKRGISKENPNRIKACLNYCILKNEESGHSWILEKDLINKANKELIIDTLDSKKLIREQLINLIKEKECVSYSYVDNYKELDLIASSFLYNCERELFYKFTKQLYPNPFIKNLPENLFETALFASLNEKQREAITLFSKYNQLVLAGKAGTGKTFVIKAITKLCENLNISFVVSAFTGRACRVLRDVTGYEAITLHRLLGFKGTHFNYDNPLLKNSQVIILDEISLIDVPLFWRLYSNVDLTNKVIVLCGDYQQLPCVGIGDIATDLTKLNILPKVILDKCMRQAGELKENCNKILDGKIVKTSENYLGMTQRKPWYKITNFKEVEDIQNYIIKLYSGSLEEKIGFDILKDVQLLTPMKKGPLGTIELNRLLQKVIQTKKYNVEIFPGQTFYVGDKVMQTRNNYELDVMNGTIGFVVNVEDNSHLWVEYDDGVKEYNSEDVFDLNLSYACTIHKYQGGQLPCVIVLIHKSHSFMHSKNLIYTGCTRAMQTAIVLGDSWAVNNCAKKEELDNRNTFLKIFDNMQLNQHV